MIENSVFLQSVFTPFLQPFPPRAQVNGRVLGQQVNRERLRATIALQKSLFLVLMWGENTWGRMEEGESGSCVCVCVSRGGWTQALKVEAPTVSDVDVVVFTSARGHKRLCPDDSGGENTRLWWSAVDRRSNSIVSRQLFPFFLLYKTWLCVSLKSNEIK